MTRALPCLLALVLAGCVSDAPTATPEDAPAPNAPVEDSEPRHEAHDLTAGLGESWWFYVAEPGGPDAVVRFALAGPAGTPRSTGDVCLTYALELAADGGTRTSEGSRGDCGGALSVSVEGNVAEEVLFELRGADVRPGTYRFEATAMPQAGTLLVDLAAR